MTAYASISTRRVRVDQRADLHQRCCRPDIAKLLAMRAHDVAGVVDVNDVKPSADHVRQACARLAERAGNRV